MKLPCSGNKEKYSFDSVYPPIQNDNLFLSRDITQEIPNAFNCLLDILFLTIQLVSL